MWPEKQRYPTDEERRRILDRNPEGAAMLGKWSDPEFLKEVSKAHPIPAAKGLRFNPD